MIKIIYRTILTLITIFLFFVLYLSTVGIKTDKLNNEISKKIKNINNNFEIELKEVSIILNPLELTFLLKTLGTDLSYKNKLVQLETIKSKISIKSLLNNQFSLNHINISTKSVDIKSLISFIRVINNDPKLFIAEKLVKKGFIVADIDIEFDENGNIQNNFKINGFFKEGKVNFLEKYKLSKIDFNFNLNQKNFELENLKLSLNDKNFLFPKVKIKKLNKKFLISGNFNNKDIILDKNEIEKIIDKKISNLEIDKIEFNSKNSFSLDIDNKLKFDNLKVNSNILLKELIIVNSKLKPIFPNFKKKITFRDHRINFEYNKKDEWSIDGSGDFIVQDKDKIKYKILKNKKNLNFSSSLNITNNLLKIDYLNYQKKDKSNLEILIKGNKDLENNLFFEKISLIENKNKIQIDNLSLKNDYLINEFQRMNLDYFDNENIKNKISIIRKNKNYILKGNILNANKIIDNLLESDTPKKKFFNQDFRIDVNIEKLYLDKDNYIQTLKGYINLKKNTVYNANLVSKFSNNKNIKFTIKTENNETITTLFSDEAKPLVNRYKFIKGFNEGSLDFYSSKKNNNTQSTLKIYDFKLKELPALTKLLTLASLQGIADLLTGEGIRFNEFEMNFSNKGQLMTIEEIYAIGPAISILMSGYVEKNKLISLRGTLVPATTLNKTIGSIPLLGDILVGKKIGEGVFGVSFKIKGPPKNLETSVNPIKTLTPRFITRTLEKIKKN